MKIHGEKMEEDAVVEKILRFMSSKFNYGVCAIKESNNVKELYIDELHGFFLVHAQKMKHVKEEVQVLIIANGARISCKGRGRDVFKNAQGQGIRLNKSAIQYLKFYNLGYFEYDCHNLKECAKYVEYRVEEDVLLTTYGSFEKNCSKNHIWLLEFGWRYHMCGIKEWFLVLDSEFRETMKLEHNSQMQVMGKGNSILHINSISQVIIDVYYIP